MNMIVLVLCICSYLYSISMQFHKYFMMSKCILYAKLTTSGIHTQPQKDNISKVIPQSQP